ncbi:MAG: [FeFe] hydrogenase H-cluster radical SAM maturase HydE, partial [Planctomycetes bacterium]|nr:[FeFe] hydrogenase H-cluster radical SAM maturase HydE [Planctomycetota bacterium]
MNRDEILTWLREDDPRRLGALWQRADRARAEAVGDAVHLRGLIEISNRCARRCLYCGLRADRAALPRYRLGADEVLACARRAVALGYGTVVLQSGEDDGLTREAVADLVARLKAETPLAVTLGLGERSDADLAAWRRAGADRYLLRFETSNRALYDRIHPPRAGERSDRLERLERLRDLGYETGGGVMVGIPGQTYADLADDVETFRRLDLDMIGIGPFIAHPDTPLGRRPQDFAAPPGAQAPATV